MQCKARAKINWSLNTVGKREDGYHLLDMVMQSVELHDTITLDAADTLSLRVDGMVHVPSTEDNLVLRAAHALRDYTGVPKGADIHLHKRIPVGAGMGGGSADAAAVLKGLNELWQLGLSQQELLTIGLKLGADIPFCLTNGLCRAQGIGEILTPHPALRPYHLVVIQPCRALSTKQVFTALHESENVRRPDTEGVLTALAEGNFPLLARSMGNTLQEVSIPLRPAIRDAITSLREHGARAAQMTGSGSAVFGVFSTAAAARTAYQSLQRKYRVCHLTYTTDA